MKQENYKHRSNRKGKHGNKIHETQYGRDKKIKRSKTIPKENMQRVG